VLFFPNSKTDKEKERGGSTYIIYSDNQSRALDVEGERERKTTEFKPIQTRCTSRPAAILHEDMMSGWLTKRCIKKGKKKNRIANTLSKMAEIYETSCQQGKRFYTLATLGVSTSKTCRETLLSQITRPT
jgi:hypothetical protein